MSVNAGMITGLGLLAVIAIGVLVFWFRFRPRDFLLMAAVCFPVVWFSRFDLIPVTFLGQHIPSHWLVLVAIIALTWPLGDRATRAAIRPAFRRLLVPLGVLFVIMFVSVLANARGAQDLLLGLRAMMFVILPFFAAWSVIRVIRFDEDSLQRVIVMIYLIAITTAGLSVLSALAPQLFATVLADPSSVDPDSARGFTTLGGANTTGTVLSCIACVASGCVLAGYRRTLSVAMLVLCFLGILTTLARATLLAFIVGQLFVFLRVAKGFGQRMAIFAAIGVFLLAPAGYRLARDYDYSLERFLIWREGSADARRVAMDAALRYGLAHPIVGGGWGLLYPYGRAALGTRDLPNVWYVGTIATPVVKPHTLYGVVLAETGIVGLFMLLLFFWRIWAALKPPDGRLDPRGNGLVAGFRASFLCIAMIAAFQDDLFLLSKLAYVLYLASLTGIMANAYSRWWVGVQYPVRSGRPEALAMSAHAAPALQSATIR